MPIQESSITVGASAVALGSNSFTSGSVTIFNMGGSGAGIVYLGGPNVTAGTGAAIASNASPQTYPTSGGKVYGISNSGNQTVRVIEIG
jgi:hypothetical protein